MAAEVVVPFDRGVEAQRELSRAEKRFGRRRAQFIERNKQTTTARERLDVAIDYFRATICDHAVNQEKAAVATEHLADRLVASADQLAKTIRRNR